MQRNPEQLEKSAFDVVIAGGGIYGAALLREAATRGLSAALIEKGDFCCATSANSLKIIHGGLRYLQQADIIRIRESVRERRAMLRIAPHLIHPLPCLMPTTGITKSRAAMFLGLLANDILSADRNRGLLPECNIGRGQVVSRATLDELVPGQRLVGSGAAIWYDAIADDTERVVVEMMQSSVENGAVAANYMQATGFLRNGKSVCGLKARDLLSGHELEIRAGVVVNACGPWVNKMLALLGDDIQPLKYALALSMNAVLKRQLIEKYAVGVPCQEAGPDKGRLMFFAPWQGVTMGGTYYRHYTTDIDTMRPTDEDTEALLKQLNSALPEADIQMEDISRIHAGLLPCKPPRKTEDDPDLLRHYQLVDHARRDAVEGLVSVLGVKYTTARDVAERTVNLLARKLERQIRPSQTAELPLPGSSDRPDVSDQPETLVGTAIRDEMAQTLSDIIYRRSGYGGRGVPAEPLLRECADAAAAVLGWSSEEKARQLDLARKPQYR